MATMIKKICYRVNIKDEKSQRKIMSSIAAIEGVESVALDMKEGKITVTGDTDPVCLTATLRKVATFAELVSVGPAKPEEFEAKKAGKKEGSNWDTENRGAKHILGVQIEGSNCDTENRGANHYLGVQRAEAVGGFGGMNPAIEDNEGSKTRIVEAVVEAVARFGDFSSIQVDIKKGMVTVVGKSVPVGVALKVREMGYRAKLLSLGPATEEEDPDEEDNEDPDFNEFLIICTTRDSDFNEFLIIYILFALIGFVIVFFVGVWEDYVLAQNPAKNF